MRKWGYVFALLCLGGFLWAQAEAGGGAEAGAPAEEGEGGGEEFEAGGTEQVEVTGQAEFLIEDAKKPITDVTMKPFEPIDSLISIRESNLEKRTPRLVDKYLADVVALRNPFLRKPVYPILVVDEVELPVKQPRRRVESWAIEIYNSAGKMVRRYEGRGNPPKSIKWDGKDDKGEPVMLPGELFHYRLILYRGNAQRKTLSEPFSVHGYWYEKSGVYGIIVACDQVFKPGREEISEDGVDRLTEVLNVVKQYYTGQSDLEVVVYTTPTFLAEARGEALRTFFLRNAALDPERLKIKVGHFVGGGPKYERIEVHFR